MVRRIQRRELLAAGLAGLVGTAGCLGGGGDGDGDGGDGTQDPQGTPTVSQHPRGFDVKIGMIRPTEGNLSVFGEEMKRVRDLAVEQVEAIPSSHTLDMPMETTDGTPESAVEAAQSLVDDGYRVIVGPASDEATLAVTEQVLVPEKVVGITPIACTQEVAQFEDRVSHPDYEIDKQMLFIGAPGTQALAKGFARPMALQGNRSVSILFEQNLYGTEIKDFAVPELELRQLEVKATVPLEETGSDSYIGKLETALADDPDALLLAGGPGSGETLLQDYYSNFGEKPIHMVDRLFLPWLPSDVDSDMSNDAVVGLAPAWFDEGRGLPDEAATSVASVFDRAYQYYYDGDKPFYQSSLIYDSIMVMFLSVLAAGENRYEGPVISDEFPTVVNNQESTDTLPAGVDYETMFNRKPGENDDPLILDIADGLVNDWQGPTGGVNYAMNTGSLAGEVTMWAFAQDDPWGFVEFDPFGDS